MSIIRFKNKKIKWIFDGGLSKQSAVTLTEIPSSVSIWCCKGNVFTALDYKLIKLIFSYNISELQNCIKITPNKDFLIIYDNSINYRFL